MPFNTQRKTPTPRFTADTYYHYAVVPGRDQAQAGVRLGLGQIGTMGALARLIKTTNQGVVDYSLMFPNRG